MKTILISFISIIALAWGWEVLSPDHLSAGSLPWVAYREGLNLTGLLTISLMSLAMVLATRPAWLERPLGGLDRIYRLHKWSGILAGAFAILHWLVEMADDPIKALFGRGGRLNKDGFSAFAEPIRDLGEDLGEWAFYVLLALIALTLWKHFSYRLWRPLHRAMPALYLLLAFHSAVLAPASYWTQPIGLLLATLLAVGTIASILSLTGRIGRSRQVSGSIISVQNPSPDIIEVSCRLNEGWRGHRPGQFALVTFDTGEGHHPFTIASAERGDRSVTFAIKALGDYTRMLSRQLAVGSPVQVEVLTDVFSWAVPTLTPSRFGLLVASALPPFSLGWSRCRARQPHRLQQICITACRIVPQIHSCPGCKSFVQTYPRSDCTCMTGRVAR